MNSYRLTFEPDPGDERKCTQALVELARHKALPAYSIQFQWTFRAANVRLILRPTAEHRSIASETSFRRFVIHCRAIGHRNAQSSAIATGRIDCLRL